jgi:hypothetical protein
LQDARPFGGQARDHLDFVVTEPSDGPDFLVTEPCDDPYKARPESDAANRAGRRPAWIRMRTPGLLTTPNALPAMAIETGARDLTRLIGYNDPTASSRPQTLWIAPRHLRRNLTRRRQNLTKNPTGSYRN